MLFVNFLFKMKLFNGTIVTASKSYFNESGNFCTNRIHKSTVIKFSS